MRKLIPIRELAKTLGMDPNNLRKILKREKVRTRMMPIVTNRGIKDTVGVPAAFAGRLIKRREQALKNTAAASN